ncbi:MAG: AhpC/TSA family protein [Pyramidobacter sp.]|nr:AhpC/TSA family protein [Pyramidobacter sp.]
MPHLNKGDRMADFTYVTPYSSANRLSETVKKCPGRTAIVFLRYYGCRMCQLDMLDYAEQYEAIRAAGGQLLVVLQSDPAKLAAQIPAGSVPYQIVCDPEQKLYREFDIRPASSKETMKDESSAAKFARIEARGLVHGDYEGEELQLPAAFVVAHDLNVTWAHYGQVISDTPTAEELAALVR